MTLLEASPQGTIFLATNDRFVRSTDGGENWTPVAGIATPPSQMIILGDEIEIAADATYRSTDDGATWTKIAELPSLPANGRPSGLTTTTSGELVMATSNGIYRLSGSTSVEGTGEHAGELMIHPNPVHGEMTILLPSPVRRSCRIELLDMQGRSREIIAGNAEPGTRRIAWRSDGIAEGIYLIRIDLDGEMLSRMVAITR
jgi:hypothetical protein